MAKCCLIRLTNPFDPPDRPRSQAAAQNETTIRQLFPGAAFEIPDIEVLNDNRRLSSPALVCSLVSDSGWVNGFTDIIVDITALPTSVIFPLLGTLATLSDDMAMEPFNLHCIVCENPEVDQQMLSEGGDYAEYINPFRGKAGLAGESDPVTTWVPVLGEHRTPVLRGCFEKGHGAGKGGSGVGFPYLTSGCTPAPPAIPYRGAPCHVNPTPVI